MKLLDYLKVIALPPLYGTSKEHSDILDACLDSGISSVDWFYSEICEEHISVNVTFKNGVKSTLWTSNFPYAYMSNNTYVHDDCDRSVYFREMPKLKQRVRIYRELKKYPKKKTQDIECLMNAIKNG